MATTNNGITHLFSTKSVHDVLQHLLSILAEKGITVFAVIDHSGEAAKAGMEMKETKLVVFGNPKSGTPIMIAAPDCALDLPLKILIAEDADGTTRVSYNSPAYLGARYGLTPDLVVNIAVIEQLGKTLIG